MSCGGGLTGLARTRFRRPQRNGPGLLFILVALVVVAAAGARFMGLTPRATFEPISTTTNVVRQEIPAPQVIVEQPASSGTIVLYHAHSTENYSPNPTHARDGNVGDIGKVAQKLKAALEAKGYTVDYHADNFDVPDFSGAFGAAATKLSRVVQSDSVVAVVDIHRDGLPKSREEGYTTANINGTPTAKLLFVVGDVSNPNLQANVEIAQAMKDYLDKAYSGIMRGIKVQHRNLNGNLHPNTLTVYIGDYHGNSLAEAEAAVEPLAEALDAVLSESQPTLAPVVTP